MWLSFIRTLAWVRACSCLKVCLVSHSPAAGGAERLIVDAIIELVARGHDVQLYTAHHDTRRCFSETLVGAPSSCLSAAACRS